MLPDASFVNGLGHTSPGNQCDQIPVKNVSVRTFIHLGMTRYVVDSAALRDRRGPTRIPVRRPLR